MEKAFDVETVSFVYRPQSWKSIERALGLTMLLLCVGFAVYLIRWEMISPEHLRSGLVSLWRDDPWLFAQLCVPILAPFLVTAKMRRTRISIDARGMRMHAKLPILGDTVDRKIAWGDISTVSYEPSRSILIFRTRRGLPWVVFAATWCRDSSRHSRIASNTPEPYLVTVVRRLGLMERKPVSNAIEEFDLMGDARTRLLVVLGAIAGLYAVIDGKMNSESWAFFNFEYVLAHIIVAVLAAAGAAVWLLSRTHAQPALDVRIVAGIALFMALVAGPASYVAGVRVNQWVGGPLEEHEYYRDAACLNLVPKDPVLPVVEYTELARAYWCQVPATKAVPVLVRRGLFGLYQIDLRPQTEAIRAFRDGGRKG